MKLFRQAIILFVSFLILISFIIGIFPNVLLQIQCSVAAETDTASREILETTINHEHLWDFKTSFIPADGIGVIDSMVVFSDGDCRRVVALEMESGDTEWVFSYHGLPSHIAVDVSREAIYVELLQNKELVALNQDGEEIWRNNSLRGQRGGILPYTLSDGSLVAYVSPRGLAQVNPDTGVIGENIPLPDSFFVVGGESLWRVSNGQLITRNATTADIEWGSEYQGLIQCCLEQVVVSSKHILLNFANRIVALDNETGALVWQFSEEQVVSNFAVVDGRILFLDVNAQLHILDEDAGNNLGFIQFSPPVSAARDIANSGSTIGSSMLVSTDDIVSIYFGDTNMLSAYRLIIDDVPQP